MKKSIVVLFAILSLNVFAQQTGSFTKNFTFSTPMYPNQARTMAYYVPANYTPTKKYKLFISLGGQGWAIASDLVSPYGPSSPGTVDELKNATYAASYGDFIAVSPSISPQAKQAGAPDGTWPYPAGADNGLPEAIINEVKALYNIDTAYVYLTGFSLGARGALTLGLESYKVLRGLLLFTPAVQGLKEAKNQDFYQTGTNPMAYYDYAKGKQIPVCITVGANDANGGGCSFCTPADPVASYKSVIIPEVNNQFTAAGASGNVKFTTVAGVGHARPPALNFHDCYTFIESKQTSTTAVSESSAQNFNLNFGANPSCGLFSFENSEFSSEQMLNISVYNMMGQVVHRSVNSVNTEVDIRSNPDGLYFIEVKAGEHTYAGKLMLKK
jgi:hypothetical protein